jgi:hypothetical protein
MYSTISKSFTGLSQDLVYSVNKYIVDVKNKDPEEKKEENVEIHKYCLEDLKKFHKIFMNIESVYSIYDYYSKKFKKDIKFILSNKYSIIRNCILIFDNGIVTLAAIKQIYIFKDNNTESLIFEKLGHLRKTYFKLLKENGYYIRDKIIDLHGPKHYDYDDHSCITYNKYKFKGYSLNRDNKKLRKAYKQYHIEFKYTECVRDEHCSLCFELCDYDSSKMTEIRKIDIL